MRVGQVPYDVLGTRLVGERERQGNADGATRGVLFSCPSLSSIR